MITVVRESRNCCALFNKILNHPGWKLICCDDFIAYSNSCFFLCSFACLFVYCLLVVTVRTLFKGDNSSFRFYKVYVQHWFAFKQLWNYFFENLYNDRNKLKSLYQFELSWPPFKVVYLLVPWNWCNRLVVKYHKAEQTFAAFDYIREMTAKTSGKYSETWNIWAFAILSCFNIEMSVLTIDNLLPQEWHLLLLQSKWCEAEKVLQWSRLWWRSDANVANKDHSRTFYIL